MAQKANKDREAYLANEDPPVSKVRQGQKGYVVQKDRWVQKVHAVRQAEQVHQGDKARQGQLDCRACEGWKAREAH